MTETSHPQTNIVPALDALATPIDRLELLPGNPRRGNIEAVAASLATFGQRKPIVANRDGTVIAGNHTLQAARSLGWSEIAVVFVDDDDTTAKAYALADNRTAELGGYDDTALATLIAEVRDADEALFAATGWDYNALAELLEAVDQQQPSDSTEPNNIYTAAINIPQYEIVGERPTINELVDEHKTKQLERAIETVDCPADVKQFLRVAAQRHTIFNYRKIAEFYPHATPEVQRLMEDSALVIIDLDDAIRNGYTKLAQTLDEIRTATDA